MILTKFAEASSDGSLRQGGKQSIAIFQGEQFIINIYVKGSSSTVLVQGKRANEIDARLRAARRE